MSEKTSPQAIRLFIAITLPDEVKAAVGQAQEQMRRAVPGSGFKWTRPEQMHLTLKFLGNVEVSRVEELADSLGRACQGFAPLRLRAERVGFFPRATSPRVVWVGIHGPEGRLQELQKSVEATVAAYTQEKPEDGFRAHITLTRVKDATRRELEVLREATDRIQDRCFGEWTADQVELIQSELTPAGARYTRIASALLASPH